MAQNAAGTEAPARSFGVLMGVKRASWDFWALNTVLFMGLLVIQFGLGMYLNLFVTIPSHHPGAGASNFFAGVWDSVSWAIVHGPAGLIAHAVIGLAIIASAIHQVVWNLKWGPRGAAWATGIGLLFVLAAGVNGGAFLIYNKDVNSLLMALFFGAAMLCYASSIYLLLRPPRGRNGARVSATESLGNGSRGQSIPRAQ
jgi:hypothetical protein